MSARIPGTPGLLRSINDRAALELLLDEGPLTRVRIGDLTGVSRPTASQIVARLEEAGLVEPTGAVQGARGPHAVMYAARTDVVVGLALDVGPRWVRAALVDVRGGVLAQVELAPAADRDAVHELTGALAAVCDTAGVPASRVGSVVVGLQAAVDPVTGDIGFVGELPGWPRRGLRPALENATGLPVHLENDVNLAAIAERDAGVTADTFSLLWVGEGIGLGSWVRGDLHRGATGGAGELGYLAVPQAAAGLDPDGNENDQDLIGGLRLLELAQRAGVEADELDAALDVVAADPAAPAAAAFLDALAPRVAVVLEPVVAVLQPEVLVLGGAAGRAGGDRLAALVAEHLDRGALGGTQVRTTAVPDLPVLRGARSVVVGQVRDQVLARVGHDHPARDDAATIPG